MILTMRGLTERQHSALYEEAKARSGFATPLSKAYGRLVEAFEVHQRAMRRADERVAKRMKEKGIING